jgi:hypothetical protein
MGGEIDFGTPGRSRGMAMRSLRKKASVEIHESNGKLNDLAGLLLSKNLRITRKFLERRWNGSSITVHRTIERSRKKGIPRVCYLGPSFALSLRAAAFKNWHGM